MRVLFLVGLLFGCASAASAQVKVSLDADRTELSLGEALTVQVTVESEGRAAPEIEIPDFNGFEVLQRRVSRPMQFSFSFGSQPQVHKSTANYLFVLQPLAAGRYTLGPAQVRVGSQVIKSRALQITVQGAAQGSPQATQPDPQATQPDPGATAQAPVRATNEGILDGAVIDEDGFLRTVISKGKPYEGEQLTVTQYLYVPERLQSPPRIMKEATTDGLWTHDLLDPQRQLESSTQNVQGKLFRAYVLRRFAAFPLRSGELTLGAMQVEVDRSSVFDLLGRSRPQGNLQLSSVPLTLDVKPLPDAGKPAGEIAVGRYALSARVDREETVTGEAVKLTAKVEGQGNLRTVALAMPRLPEIDILQPQVRDLMQVQGGVVQGTRQFEWLLVPKQPGQLTLPPLVLQTFDPASQRYVELKSEALSLRVAGNALPTAAAAAAPGPTAEPAAAPDRADAPSVPAGRWPTLRTRSELARSTPRVVDQPWFAALLAFGPLLWLGILIGSALRTRLAARAQLDGPERSRRQARQKLGQAEEAARAGDATALYSACAAAIHEQLQAQLGESTLGVSRAQLRQILDARGMDTGLAAEIVSQLERAEFARFGVDAGGTQALGAELERVRKLVARIDALALVVVLALGCLVSALAPASARAESLTSLFEEGNAAFYAGDLELAVKRYEALLAAGVRDPDVYFNLGTAYGRQGKLGLAILDYERSLRLDPGADDAIRGLALAQEALGHRRAARDGEATVRTRPPLAETLVQPFSENQLAFVTLIACLGLFGVLIVRRFARGESLRIGLGVAAPLLALLLVLGGLGLAVRADWLADGAAAVVLVEDAPLREGPDPRAAERGRAPEGARARLFEREAGFVRVQLGDALGGWLAAGQVAAIQD